MTDLQLWEYGAIALLFVWGGFVRSGLGFGGAVLTLPFLLMIRDEPLLFLPLISVHLLLFSGVTVWLAHRADRAAGHEAAATVNWAFLRYALPLMIVPKLIGVAGVITLPGPLVSGFIFCTITLYGISYLLGRPFKSGSTRIDALFLMIGGYVSGVSLIAAPLVVPVAASRMPKEQLRDTLFVLWFVLVALKLLAFILSGVDLQWFQHLWLLPAATVGHFLGLRFHAYSMQADTKQFFRYLGAALLLVSIAGLARLAL
ncbi:MAG: TSUP family transporter [Pseudomonadota bacterium]